MKFKFNKIRLMLLLLLFTLVGVCLPQQKAIAAPADTAVRVAAVEYYDENIIVFNNDNTKIYYATDSDAARNDWECIDADAGEFTMIDFSWLSPASQNVLMIKGDKDATVSRVVIKAQPSRLIVAINYSNMAGLNEDDTIAPLLNIMSTEGTADRPITYDDLEWKKGDNGKWQNTGTLTVGLLEKFLVRGTDLYFRIRALDDGVSVDNDTNILNDNRKQGLDGGIRNYAGHSFGEDYPDGTQGRRFSDPVKIKIIKKTVSNVSGVDGSRFTAAIKYGKEYMVTATDLNGKTLGASADWIQVTDKAVKKISLAALTKSMKAASPATQGAIDFDGITKPFPAMDIEVRDFATAKSAASQTTRISLDAQRTLNKDIQLGQPSSTGNYDTDDIFVYYFGDKYVMLTIPKASGDIPYEYTIVKPNATLNNDTATWTSITRGTAVKLLSTKAMEDATLYVRQKEIKSKPATDVTSAVSYQLASTVVSYQIHYPSTPVVTKASLVYTKGYSATSPFNIEIQLNELNKVPFETGVASIKLGSKSIEFTPSTTPTLAYNADNTIDSTKVYTLTLTLKNADLEAMTNCTNRLLTITFKNGTVDKTSVKLTVRNSTPAGSLTLSPAAGATGKTKISVVSSVGPGNHWVYTTTPAAAPAGIKMEDTLDTSDPTKVITFIQGDEIPVTPNQYVTIYELDTTNHVIKYRSIQITDSMIGK